jgi:quercetin dioxygenase-like cupin family protein
MNRQMTAAVLFLASAGLGASTGWAEGGHTVVTPDDLEWADVGSLPAGAQLAIIEGNMAEEAPVTARIRFPAEYELPPHYHSGVERVTVLSGTFNIGMGEAFDRQKAMALEPGSVIIMEPNTTHFVWTEEETVVQLNVMGPWAITYVDPADDPRKK